ncbi:hypothetical protein K501DRAFT_265275 [Backusella circina FSU 941]|nr:hypothetical protein K501DRAFT_265275 [Backusella circina FSU 941]
MSKNKLTDPNEERTLKRQAMASETSTFTQFARPNASVKEKTIERNDTASSTDTNSTFSLHTPTHSQTPLERLKAKLIYKQPIPAEPVPMVLHHKKDRFADRDDLTLGHISYNSGTLFGRFKHNADDFDTQSMHTIDRFFAEENLQELQEASTFQYPEPSHQDYPALYPTDKYIEESRLTAVTQWIRDPNGSNVQERVDTQTHNPLEYQSAMPKHSEGERKLTEQREMETQGIAQHQNTSNTQEEMDIQETIIHRPHIPTQVDIFESTQQSIEQSAQKEHGEIEDDPSYRLLQDDTQPKFHANFDDDIDIDFDDGSVYYHIDSTEGEPSNVDAEPNISIDDNYFIRKRVTPGDSFISKVSEDDIKKNGFHNPQVTKQIISDMLDGHLKLDLKLDYLKRISQLYLTQLFDDLRAYNPHGEITEHDMVLLMQRQKLITDMPSFRKLVTDHMPRETWDKFFTSAGAYNTLLPSGSNIETNLRR